MAIVPTIRGLNEKKAVAEKKDYLEDELDKDHVGYELTKIRCLGKTTPDRFPEQCEERLRWYKSFSPLNRDTHVKVMAYWAYPRFADTVRLTESEREYVESLTATMLEKTIGIHNWHIPPKQGRCKGPDFNPIFSSVMDVGGIPILLRDRERNLRGQFCALLNYAVSQLNLERSRKGQTLIPTVAQAKKQNHLNSGNLFLCEQLACLPQPPTTVLEVIKGLELLGYDVQSTTHNEISRVRNFIRSPLDLGTTQRNSGFTVSLPGLVQEVALVRERRQSQQRTSPARTTEPVKPVPPVITPPVPPPLVLDWADEEKFLLALAKKAARHAQQLRAAFDAKAQFAVLRIIWKEDYAVGTATLSDGADSITMVNYRPLFTLQSAVIRHHFDRLGLVVPLPTTLARPISAEDHRSARLFTLFALLRDGLWWETGDKLSQPKIRAVLEREWPTLATEPDEALKIKRLHRDLTQTGQLNIFEAGRVVLAVCDPLAQRLGTVGPKALGIEKQCAPRIPLPSKPRDVSKPSVKVPAQEPVMPASLAPTTPTFAFHWAEEESFLLSLAKQAAQQDKQLRVNLYARDRFAVLGLEADENKHSGTITLSQGTKSITLPQYRPNFVVQATSFRCELASLGLGLDLPEPRITPISVEEHIDAQTFARLVHLDTWLWTLTRDKLRQPSILAALRNEWPNLITETDELAKAKRLHQTLMDTGRLTKTEVSRVVFAVCDPLGQRLGTIGPQVLDIEHLIRPGKTNKPMTYDH